ncbi:MnmC family methyltransferase [Spirobacillus cienkowskii]|uniref:MnmC family methyltransferase n=1 Tax=Spirobacillus cienkowskii TaxID=495820 RepID=UPI0030D3B2CA
MLENVYFDKASKYTAEFVLTSDHSFSLRLNHTPQMLTENSIQSDTCLPELMHSTAGAFSETIYVYLPVVKAVIERDLPLHFLSIGLGLGYIEVMIIAYCLSQQKQVASVESFEAVSFLGHYFINYFLEKYVPQKFVYCYNDIIQRNSVYFGVNQETLKSNIKDLILKKKININSKFTENSAVQNPAHGIFFDAFSQISSPELWTQSLFNNIFSKNCSAFDCIFATYASKGILKTQLKNQGFVIHKKQGFFKKRECIFAERQFNKLPMS